MSKYQKVKSSVEISMGIVNYLELVDHPWGKGNRNELWEINDVLQGRGKVTVEELFDRVREKSKGWYPDEIKRFEKEIEQFRMQKELREKPYEKVRAEDYQYEMTEPAMPQKIIDQKLYDRAVEEGFPKDFFRNSYFESVAFYCLPDGADFQESRISNCTFAVCRIKDAHFENVYISDTEFHSCDIQGANFFAATMICNEFQDSTLRDVSFREATLKAVYTRDCMMEETDFSYSMLNGCDFTRTAVKGIEGVEKAAITHSGATAQEVEERRRVIRKALGVVKRKEKKLRKSERGR